MRTATMRAITLAAAALLLPAVPALAQGQPAAPSAGSGGGGDVGPSVSQPRAPTGATPPGTANAQATRDAAGQAVIGKTSADNPAVPGQTDGKEAGVGR